MTDKKSDETVSSLTPKQLRFVVEYFAMGNATEAYRAAYDCSRMTNKTVGRNAHALLANNKIAAIVAQRKSEAVDNAGFGLKDAFNELVNVATADATELMNYRRLNCRHCHGVDHAYQWTDEAEYAREYAAWEDRNARAKKKTPPPSDEGGYGFAFNADPHPGCPQCRGEGITDVYFTDTRKLSDGARRLFNGVKVTKDGVTILLRDRDAAVDKIVRMLGGYKDSLVLHPGAAVDSAKDLPMDAAEASRLYAERLKGGK